MNTQRFIAAAVLAFTAAGSAFAAETAYVETGSTLSRAEVQAELVRARAAGQVNQPGEGYSLFRADEVKSTTSRAEVLAELARARANGEIQTGEAYALFPQRAPQGEATAVARSREDVRAEALRAARTRNFDVSYIGG